MFAIKMIKTAANKRANALSGRCARQTLGTKIINKNKGSNYV
jgi:hypothetical protein